MQTLHNSAYLMLWRSVSLVSALLTLPALLSTRDVSVMLSVLSMVLFNVSLFISILCFDSKLYGVAMLETPDLFAISIIFFFPSRPNCSIVYR